MRAHSPSIAETKGTRSKMQDAGEIKTWYGATDGYTMGVFDGHGNHGALVAQWAAIELVIPRELGSTIPPEDLARHIGEKTRELHNTLRTRTFEIGKHAGATATVACTDGRSIAVSHSGDSAALWVADDRAQEPTVLTPIHDLSNRQERERIMKGGYEIVQRTSQNGRLIERARGEGGDSQMVTRCIGDADMGFVDPSDEVHVFTPRSPGTLALMTDGVYANFPGGLLNPGGLSVGNLIRTVATGRQVPPQELAAYIVGKLENPENAMLATVRIDNSVGWA